MGNYNSKLALDLPLLLPEVSDTRDRCVRTLMGLLGARDGLAKVHIVDGDGAAPAQLCIHYDCDRLSLARVRELALAAGAKITGRFGHLTAMLSPPPHARAARSVAARLRKLAGVLEAEVSASGVFRIEFDRSQADLNVLTAELRAHGLRIDPNDLRAGEVALDVGAQPQQSDDSTHRAGDHKHPQKGQTKGDKEHEGADGGLFGENTEFAFSLITGALLLSGWLLGRFEMGPAWIPTALYVAAYGFGGWFTLREAIHNLRARRFEIDTLMLVAAAGAAALGEWAEGALLLFLFSLGHALEHWAMGRARRAIEALAELAPETALVKRGDRTEEVPVESLAQGDVIIVRPNERLAADGIVVAGVSSVNQCSTWGLSWAMRTYSLRDSIVR